MKKAIGLNEAIYQGDLIQVQGFKKELDPKNMEHLELAVGKNHLEIVRYLLRKGYQDYVDISKSRELLSWACINGYVDIVKVFGNQIRDVNQKRNNQLILSLIELSISFENFDISDYLIKTGECLLEDIDLSNLYETSLRKKKWETVRYLCQRKIRLDLLLEIIEEMDLLKKIKTIVRLVKNEILVIDKVSLDLYKDLLKYS
jgi:ankyrin repeat protein